MSLIHIQMLNMSVSAVPSERTKDSIKAHNFTGVKPSSASGKNCPSWKRGTEIGSQCGCLSLTLIPGVNVRGWAPSSLKNMHVNGRCKGSPPGPVGITLNCDLKQRNPVVLPNSLSDASYLYPVYIFTSCTRGFSILALFVCAEG